MHNGPLHNGVELQLKKGVEAADQGLTESDLLAELKQTRKTIFAETYGDPANL